jgi:hypothetical protein
MGLFTTTASAKMCHIPDLVLSTLGAHWSPDLDILRRYAEPTCAPLAWASRCARVADDQSHLINGLDLAVLDRLALWNLLEEDSRAVPLRVLDSRSRVALFLRYAGPDEEIVPRGQGSVPSGNSTPGGPG